MIHAAPHMSDLMNAAVLRALIRAFEQQERERAMRRATLEQHQREMEELSRMVAEHQALVRDARPATEIEEEKEAFRAFVDNQTRGTRRMLEAGARQRSRRSARRRRRR